MERAMGGLLSGKEGHQCWKEGILLSTLMQERIRHMTHSHAGMPGMPQMSEEELMRETIQTAGSSVSRGKVRRKKDVRKGRSGRGGLAELASLR